MQRQEIIELSNQLTERKGERVLNLQTLFGFVVQDICKRQRFWWRRIQFTFNLVIGQPTYAFSDMKADYGLSPVTALDEIAVEEITKFSLIVAPNPMQIAEMVAVFDPETLIEMINNTSLTSPTNGQSGVFINNPGGRYTMDANDYETIRIDPPDAAYPAFIVGWAMPNPNADTTNQDVPLIPAWGHNTIVAGMNAKIFKFAYGSKNEKTLDAIAEYEQGLQDLMSKKQFDPNYRSQLISTEDAVRST